MKETIEFYFKNDSHGDRVKISISESHGEVDMDSDVSNSKVSTVEKSTALRLNRSITARYSWLPGWTVTDEDAKPGSCVELPKKLDADTIAVTDKPLKDVNHCDSHNRKRNWDTFQQNLQDHRGLKHFSLRKPAVLPNLPSAEDNIWHVQNYQSPREAVLFDTSDVPKTFLSNQNVPHGDIFSRNQCSFDEMEVKNLSAVYKSQHEESNMSLGSISGFSPVITRAGGTIALYSPHLVSGEHPKDIPFNSPENSCAQLTLFYAGSVSVFNNIPVDQAHAIMNFAGTRNSWSVNSQRPPSKQVSNTSNAISSSFSRASQPASDPPLPCTISRLSTQHIHPTMSPSMQNNPSTPRTLSSRDSVQPADNKQQELIKVLSSCQSVVPRALPQARKASLSRFLENRRERIKSIVQYLDKDSCQEVLLHKGRKSLDENAGTVFYDETLGIHAEGHLGSKHKLLDDGTIRLQDASVCEMDVEGQNWLSTAEKNRF